MARHSYTALFFGTLLLVGCVSNNPAPVIDHTPPPKSAVADPGIYVVKRGDTLSSIAREQRLDPRELMAWNRLPENARLAVGQAIRIKAPATEAEPPPGGTGLNLPVIDGKPLGPPPGHASVISTPPTATNAAPPSSALLKTQPKGVKLPYTEQNLALLQKVEPPPVVVDSAPPKPVGPAPSGSVTNDGVDWAWPAPGGVIAKFAESGGKGVEISGREGDPVYAAAAGKVTYAGTGVRGYGNLVIIKHNDQYLSAYAHNKNIAVKQGQSVTRGQKIADLGSSGTDTPKLHFEIRYLGKPVDPVDYLPPRN